MTAPILRVEDLRTHFHLEDSVVRAVDGLHYELHAGKTLAVVGESGSGKSVHALSILRLLPEPPARIVSGRILFHGQDLLGLSPKEMRGIRGNRIAMIFQEPMTSLNPVMRVGDQIAESVIAHKGVSREKGLDRAAYLLERVGIPHARARLNDYPHQFSGGMRQRVMIAIALACDPEILIADEPTTALDVTVQAQILELLRELQREFKMAVVLITHNLGIVAEVADDVVVMYAGRAVEHAPVKDLFARPQHPYTRGLLASLPSLFEKKDKLEAITGQPPDLSKPIAGCPFAPRCPEVKDRCRHQDSLDFLPSPHHLARCWIHEGRPVEKREQPAEAA